MRSLSEHARRTLCELAATWANVQVDDYGVLIEVPLDDHELPMQPLIDAPPPVHPYAPASWGPQEAASLVAGHGRWHEPWIEQ